ncbi:MAG: glycosyl transferase family 1 [Burkholderiales bacterium]|nr:glycosyl transferase family 1 [Burkholderiales bacterium]
MSRRRVLFVAEAVTLAHVARPVALASRLDPQRWEVRLATDPRYAKAIGAVPFPTEAVWSISSDRFSHALAHGTPIFDAPAIQRYVEEELVLFDRLRPDVVVGDFRISLGISARRAGVPYINITNAYWSPYALIRHVVPEITVARLLGARIGQVAFDVFRRAGYAAHVVPVNRVRRRFGMPRLAADFRWAIMDADETLYADIPEVVPTKPLPTTHRFIGPIPWVPAASLPAWWPEVERVADRRPVIYVNLGSSGAPGALEKVLHALDGLDATMVAATAGRKVAGATPVDALIADFLPGDRAASLADVVVCNGGSPSSYQALAAGKPVIGMAANTDQFLNMAAVEDAGAGVLLRAHRSSAAEIRGAVVDALRGGRLAVGARRIQNALSGFDPFAHFDTVLRNVCSDADT